MKRFISAASVAALGLLTATAVNAQTAGSIDFANAKPMPLPLAPDNAGVGSVSSEAAIVGRPVGEPGAPGNGVLSPVRVAPAKATPSAAPTPEQHGTLLHTFTTSRVQLAPGPAGQRPTVESYPYRATGKLFFRDGASTFVCSASLIKRGVIITAAHCVSKFGANRYYTNFQYVPAYNNGAAPFGVWTGVPIAPLSYRNGTDVCAAGARGVVCASDVALIAVTPKTTAPTYPGTATGWLGWGANGFGFAPAVAKFAPKPSVQITQLGYPVALDGGLQEQRTDSMGYRDAAMVNNTIIGSLQTGGSSGGPWVLNLGTPPVLSAATAFGTAPNPNLVVGVTSWGYTNPALKEQGASPLTSANFVTLLNAVCGTANPSTNPRCR